MLDIKSRLSGRSTLTELMRCWPKATWDSSGVLRSVLRECHEEGIDFNYYVFPDRELELDLQGVYLCRFTRKDYTLIEIQAKESLARASSLDLLLCVLAHEMGHHFEYMLHLDNLEKHIEEHGFARGFIGKAMNKLERSQQTLVYKIEVDAWDRGYDLLKRHGYKNWAYFFACRDHYLASYIETYHI